MTDVLRHNIDPVELSGSAHTPTVVVGCPNRQPGCGAFGSGTLNLGSDGGANGLVVGGGAEGRVHDGTRDVLLLSVDVEGFSLGGAQAVNTAATASTAANRTLRDAILRTLVDRQPLMGLIFACAAQ